MLPSKYWENILSFYIAAIIIGLACSVITIRTLVSYSDTKLHKKILISIVVLYGWLAPFTVEMVRKYNFFQGDSYAYFSNISYYLFGFCFIVFSLLIIRDLLWYIVYGIARIFDKTNWSLNPKNICVLDKANMIVVVIGFMISMSAIYEGCKAPDIKDITVKSTKLDQNTSVVLLSDLHINRASSTKNIEKLVNRVNALKPDVITLTGDVIDDRVDLLTSQMEALSKLKAKYGVYVSFGNHELYNGIASWQKKFVEMGFVLLFNNGTKIGNTNIYLAGVPDSHTASMSPMLNVNFYKALKGSNLKQFKLLMSHTPDFVDYLSPEIIDLQLSGHTHGGQIFPFHLMVKKANKYLAGLYKVRGLKLYVSRGVGTWGPMMRFLAPSEITLISLQPKK